MAWASPSSGAETRVAGASPATSHTLEMTGMSQIATAHHTLPKKQLLVLGLDGLADVPEEIDQRHRCAADDCRPAGDEDADLPATSQVRVAAVCAESPYDRRHNERQHAEDEADGHDRTDNGAQLVNAR